MKIVYSIFSKAGKPGGHFFSFEHTITAMSERIDPVILYLGKEHPVIDSLPFKKYHVVFSLSSIGEVKKIISKENPDAIHCFDLASYRFLSLSLCFKNVKFLLTIPGGNPNPQKLPYCKDIILFSQETMKSFQCCKRFRKTSFYYIPNRVNYSRLNQSETPKDGFFKLVQIIRIAEVKHNQIVRTLNLLRILVNQRINVKLILAGTINTPSEKKYIDEFILSNDLNNNFEFISDKRVYRGSDLLSLGDCVIATGRSVMEAAALKKIILVPTKNVEFPVLLDEQNFEGLFHFNFSGRTPSQYGQDEFKKIERLLTDNKYKEEIIRFVSKKCEQYFLLSDEVISLYCKIYDNLLNQNKKIVIYKNLQSWVELICRLGCKQLYDGIKLVRIH